MTATLALEDLDKYVQALAEICDLFGVPFLVTGTGDPADIVKWLSSNRQSGREALQAATRAAKLALFVINKQGVMPNSSWEAGFNSDLAKAEAALGTKAKP